MIKYLLSSIVLLTATQCNDNAADSALEKDAAQPKVIGNQRDANGCLTSTGATYSILKQDCIQVFNVGQRLNPVGLKVNDVVISAFILLSDDRSQMELFLPDDSINTVILEMVDDNTYEKDIYKYRISDASLYINNVKKYTAEN